MGWSGNDLALERNSFVLLSAGAKMQKINDFTLWMCKGFIMLMVFFMTAVIFAQVVMRYVFLSPFPWAEEVGRYLLIWISSLGAAYAVRRGEHIGVMFIHNKFRGYTRLMVNLIIHILVIAFSIICLVEGIHLSFRQWDQLSAALRIPMTFAYFAIPFSFALIIMYTLELIAKDVKQLGTAQD
jgi:TRAP-type C4-dicarboxylate transport system permease small subunit